MAQVLLKETGSAEATPLREGGGGASSAAPRWETWGEALAVVAYPPYLKRTVRTAAVVGSILFALNHLDEVVLGRATPMVWLKGVVTYLVPFCVSNIGVLIASRRTGIRQE